MPRIGIILLSASLFTSQIQSFQHGCNGNAWLRQKSLHGTQSSTHDTDTSTSLMANTGTSSDNNIVLPIFPLRKRVKFPTERLKLTLWEERYKMLSRFVLENAPHPNNPMFGALYCSHKTQIVKSGRKPITPIVDVGDIGIICSVTSSQVFIDGEEVSTSRKDEADVEKIRLWGLGVARFRVEKILSDGLDGDRNEPFILVEASRIDDENIFQDGNESHKVGALLNELLDRDGHSFDENNLFDDKYAYAFLRGERRKQIQQMMSFALTSKLEASAPANEMLEMLKCTSTLERLEYLDRKLPGKSFISVFRSLFN